MAVALPQMVPSPLAFIFLGQMSYTRYLFSHANNYSKDDRPSGDSSNGFRYTGCSPVQALFSGFIRSASIGVTGAAVPTAKPTSGNVILRTQLFEVGFSGEGTSKGYIDFLINAASFNVGAYYDSSVLTAFAGSTEDLNITITAGKLYALKFVSMTTAGYISTCTNLAVTLETVKS